MFWKDDLNDWGNEKGNDGIRFGKMKMILRFGEMEMKWRIKNKWIN